MAIIEIKRTEKESLTSQVYRTVRGKIQTGELAAGFRLPSSRNLAEELHVSRNVCMNAYEQLAAEGYIESKPGSGNYVAEGNVLVTDIAIADIKKKRRPIALDTDKAVPPMGLSGLRNDVVDFRSGLPDLSIFPKSLWLKLTKQVLDSPDHTMLAYGHPEGRWELREAIAKYLSLYRGVRCEAAQIVITAGTTQAVGILARLLCAPGESFGRNTLHSRQVLLEDPLTRDISRILKLYGAEPVPVPIDNDGLIIQEIPTSVNPAFVYTTPSHQFPLGITTSASRRIALLEYCREKSAFVVEDDYDSEFRFDVQPLQTFHELDPKQVIYLGTFSKTVFPALRIGYMVLPPRLFEKGREIKWFSDLHNATLDQLVLARFISQDHFVRYIAKMKKIQYQRRQLFKNILQQHFGNTIQILGAEAGLHCAIRFSGASFSSSDISFLEKKGVQLYPVEDHTLQRGRYTDTLIFGYGILDGDRMKKGITVLADYMDSKGL